MADPEQVLADEDVSIFPWDEDEVLADEETEEDEKLRQALRAVLAVRENEQQEEEEEEEDLNGPGCYVVLDNASEAPELEENCFASPCDSDGAAMDGVTGTETIRIDGSRMDIFGDTEELDSLQNFAFVAILFGPKVGYCIDALVLGEALRSHATQYPYILLITHDVPLGWQTVLQKVGWELRTVDYLDGDHFYYAGSKGRFAGVFTKLHALSLTEFTKIVMLDLDLLVRAPIDCLFERNAPSAMRRHASADFIDGERIKASKLIDHRGHLISGINAGVMVLRPSMEHFVEMLEDINEEKRPAQHLKSGMPEQDYLTRFYRNDWHNLSVAFNFQPHQLAFCDRRGLESSTRLTLDYDMVSIVHFSASVKPRDLLITPEYREMPERKFAQEVLFKQYIRGIHTDRRSNGYSKLDPNAIEAQLRAATIASTGEWFIHWRALEARFPELEFLVDAAEFLADVPKRQPCNRSRSRSHSRSRSQRQSRRKGKKGKGKGARRRRESR